MFCEDISVEYEFKLEKFRGVSIDLNNVDLSGNAKRNRVQNTITDARTLTSIYIDFYILRDGVCQNLSFPNIFGGNFCAELGNKLLVDVVLFF